MDLTGDLIRHYNLQTPTEIALATAIVSVYRLSGMNPVFGIPREQTMYLSRIGSRPTYYKALDGLVRAGVIEIVSKPRDNTKSTTISINPPPVDLKESEFTLPGQAPSLHVFLSVCYKRYPDYDESHEDLLTEQYETMIKNDWRDKRGEKIKNWRLYMDEAIKGLC